MNVQFIVQQIPLRVELDLANRQVAFVKPNKEAFIAVEGDTEVIYHSSGVNINEELFYYRRWYAFENYPELKKLLKEWVVDSDVANSFIY